MTQATINGNTYSDDGSAAKDMNNGGHRTHFLPLVNDVVTVAGQVAADKATVATDKAVVTADKSASQSAASAASASSIAAQGHANIATTKSNEAAASAVQSAASAVAAAAIVTGVASNRPSIRPSLLLDFANTKQLDPRITFSRASTGLYYDGKTVAKAEENLLLRSQEFENGNWFKIRATVTENSTAAPDGSTTADTLTQPTGQTSGGALTQSGLSASNGLLYTISFFAKPNGKNFISIGEDLGTGSIRRTYFNISTGAVGTTDAGHTASITASTNGFYRCVITFSANASRSGIVYLFMADSDNSTTVVDSGGIYIWGAQLEQRSTVTAYTPTTTAPITNYIPAMQTAAANVARFDHYPVTGESKGLLIEEQRTNLLTYSADLSNAAWTKSNSTITADTVVAPDGTLTGDKLVEDATNNQHSTYKSYVPASGAVTFSCYVKAAGRTRVHLTSYEGSVPSNPVAAVFDLSSGTVVSSSGLTTASSIAPVGNGWYRCSVSGASAGTSTSWSIMLVNTGINLTYTGDGYSGIYIWGAQLEAGSFPTSYIPTVASQVTRSADSASMTGANFSSWYRADEGTLYAEGASTGYVLGSNFPVLATADDGSSTNRITLFQGGSSTGLSLNVLAAGVSTTTANSNVNLSATAAKIAGGYLGTTQSFSVNGGASNTATTNGVPSGIRGFYIGNRSPLYLNALNGTIKRIAFWPKRLSNSELQGLTS